MINTNDIIKKDYKQTIIGTIPKDWKVKELGDLCGDICGEYGANKSAIPYSSSLPRYVRITDINDEGNLHFDSKASANLSLEEEKKFKLEHHDLLFARTGATVGKSYLHRNETDEKFVYAGFLIRFRLCPNKVNPIFIKGYTDTSKYWHWVKTYSARSGQPGLNSNEYKSLKIPIPPLPEQKAIADCLSTWDKGIEKLSALIASKKEQKKGLMQQLLTGKKRLDGFTEEWKEVRLKEVIKLQGGYAFKSGRFKKEGIPVIRISNLSAKSSEVDLSDVVYYSKISQTNFDVSTGDLLIAMSGATTGKTAIYTNPNHAYLNQRVGLFKNKSNKELDYRILYYIVQTNYFNNEINKMLSTGAQPNISSSDIENINIYLPTIKEQIAISDVLDASDKEIKLLQRKLETFKIQKKGLMQMLLTGEKRLVDS